jgi:hypothetical protein
MLAYILLKILSVSPCFPVLPVVKTLTYYLPPTERKQRP